ncbi:MAG: hypothetical protein KGY76_03020 [Candidatus Thermoplasmatota archaeon]|nr:hypothetical protein [Candidatus Thermoplasmatota archaeon]
MADGDDDSTGGYPDVQSKPLKVSDLTAAIKNSVDEKGMETSAAQMMAEHVMNFFGFSDRIIDNILEQEDRDVFYMLEDAGLLTTEREETTLYDGREWRIHYWLFERDKINELIESQSTGDEAADEKDDVYEDVPEGVWSSRMESEG